MGICESITGAKNEAKIKPLNKNISPKKPVNNFQEDEKSDDTMDYVKIPTNQSLNSEMMKKKFEDKSTNDTNNLREKIKTQNYEQINDLNNITDINLNKTNVSSNYQEETTPKMNPLLNSDYNNKINQNNNDNTKNLNNGNSFMNTSSRLNNNNSNSVGGFSNNYKNNIIKNSNKINVSMHESHLTQSAYINIPKQEQKPISISNIFSASLLESQK
jgi:hypothetical protein